MDNGAHPADLRPSPAGVIPADDLFRALVENNQVGISQLDPDGIVQYANPALCGMFEVDSAGEIEGRHYTDFYTPQTLEVMGRELSRRRLGVTSSYEVEIVGRRGGRRHALVCGTPLNDASGRFVGMIATFTDVTELKRSRESHARSESKYRVAAQHLARSRDFYLTLLLNFPAPVWRSSIEGKCNYVNLRWQEFAGMTAEQARGDGWAAILHPDDRQRHLAAFEAAFARLEPYEMESRIHRHDGEYRWVRDFGAPFHDLDGSFAGYIGMWDDITDRKHAQEQLLHAQRIESVGRLAGGIAHDFNNLLAVISGYSEAMLRRTSSNHALREHIQEIQRAASRGAGLTQQLLAFSRRQDAVPQAIDLSRAVENVYLMLRRLITTSIDIEIRATPEPAIIKADPGQIEQVLVNLALNARDALPDGGKVIFETAAVRLAAGEVEGLAAGGYVQLCVVDTGSGISADIRSRIFEPFFTTKEGAGTGLGLSIVYGIVQQAGGSIFVRSAPGKGTQFDLYFPVFAQ